MPDTRCEICADTGFDYLGRPCRRGPHIIDGTTTGYGRSTTAVINVQRDANNTEAVQLVRMLVNTLKFETSRHAEFRTDTAQSAIDRAEAWLSSQAHSPKEGS